ncbi:MAG TPA: hypothetical protein VH210_04930 [Gaiellaceae bacterium]|jgi:hypothetical protein|nr:hypothetical protein [Gaiellaceae bacterium]
MSYLSKHGTRRVPQWLRLAGQVANSAGGHAWAVAVWTRLRHYLILGSESGSYYASKREPTRENANRRASGIDARLVVVGMVSNGFSIADPTGTATPLLISDFARGAL